jgi:integrase/recombinase XerC
MPGLAALRTPAPRAALPRPLSAEDALSATAPRRGRRPAWIGLRDAAALLLMYGAGLRIGEVLSLSAADKPDGGALRVTGKGNKTRVVPVLAVIADAIDAYLSACPFALSGDDPLFVGGAATASTPA